MFRKKAYAQRGQCATADRCRGTAKARGASRFAVPAQATQSGIGRATMVAYLDGQFLDTISQWLAVRGPSLPVKTREETT
jgi:hypothetical protein